MTLDSQSTVYHFHLIQIIFYLKNGQYNIISYLFTFYNFDCFIDNECYIHQENNINPIPQAIKVIKFWFSNVSNMLKANIDMPPINK